MHLAWYHKIDLIRFDGKRFKIDSVRSGAIGKKHHVIKRMPVGCAQVSMMIEVWGKPAYQYIVSAVTRKGADIVYGCFFHTTKV